VNLAIVGGGPAGLRAAEVAVNAGLQVTLFEGKPSVGRKFLVAGHGGLNLSHSEPPEQFATRYQGGASIEFWYSLIQEFGNQEIRAWAADLGIETFIGTSGRVFPKEFKAAPLLRRWVERLRSRGVRFQPRHYLQGIRCQDDLFTLEFLTPEGIQEVPANSVILALGGASWPETGSDATWIPILKSHGIEITPMSAANCGWEVNWHPDILTAAEGLPLKNIIVSSSGKSISGELLITLYGLEGGALYQLGYILRSQLTPTLTIDLKPSYSVDELINKITSNRGDLLAAAAKAWRLHPAPLALLKQHFVELSPSAPLTPARLAESAKALPITLTGPRPIEEGISSAGGVSFSELDEHLMVKRLPGLFVAGEMIDWEAPTGGYLLQGCFATGTRAAQGALEYLKLKDYLPGRCLGLT
jgi:uncharacterized flavoprotein (TIGR03862 family)